MTTLAARFVRGGGGVRCARAMLAGLTLLGAGATTPPVAAAQAQETEAALVARARAIAQLWGGNLLRVLREVERVAATSR